VAAFANLSVSRKLTAAFAAVVAVILVSSAVLYERLTVIEDAKKLQAHSTEVLQTLGSAELALLDQVSSLRGYLATSDDTFLHTYQRSGEEFTRTIRRLKDLAPDNSAQERRVDELDELARKWRLDIAEREIAPMAMPETRELARAWEDSRAGKAAIDLVRVKVDEIAGVEREVLAKRDIVQRHAFAHAFIMAFLGGAISLAVALLMGLLLSRGITLPIIRMTDAMTVLAKGDTSVKVPGVGRSDELGAMAAAVGVFRDSIIERQKTQAELAHVNRIATMGQMTASIAHEVSQPIAAAVTNAQAALRWLRATPPNLDEVREALDRVVEDNGRAGAVITRIRALVKKTPSRKDRFGLNEAILDVVALTRSEVLRHGVSLQTDLEAGLPLVDGDRVQLQQVILNLILNAIEAMSGMVPEAQKLQVGTKIDAEGNVLVTVQDSGPGLDPTSADRVFEAFYTTKPDGMGMGLAICRSIIEAHGGCLWVSSNEPTGAVFSFTLPANA
jgi:signal transduction histidine kinase